MKRIEIISLDRIGLVGEITNVIRCLNGNIITHNANVTTNDKNIPVSHFSADIHFESSDGYDLVSRKIRKIKSVKQVRITEI